MNDSIAQTTDQTIPSPGGQLQAARIKAGMTVRDAADKMHFLPRQVLALESDDYNQFNGDVFCKGYIKTYAKLLGLDASVLLETYCQLKPAACNPTKVNKLSSQPEKKDLSIVYWCLIASFVVVALLWLLNSSDNSEDNVDSNQNADTEQVVVPAATSSKATIGSEESESTLGSGVIPVVKQTVEPAESSSMVEPLGDFSDIAIREGITNSAEDTAKENTLAFSFLADSWVQIKDKNERTIFADIKKTSQTLALAGQAPFYIVLGYAPGVKLNYNNQQVEIPVNRENNSARFVVGETE
jgi:cytoskeleton protein RodZ